MFEDEFDRGHLLKLDTGEWVERDVLRIVEQIRQYDPNLRVQYLETAASLGDAPYRVVEHCKDGKDRIVFYCWTLDQRVLDRIYAADNNKLDVMGRIDSHNDKVRRNEQQRYEDRLGEAGDIMRTALRSRKGRWTFKDGNRKVTIDDDPKPSWKVKETD